MSVCVRVSSVGFGPGLDSMSPARSRRSGQGHCGTPTTSRLYPFGACFPSSSCSFRYSKSVITMFLW